VFTIKCVVPIFLRSGPYRSSVSATALLQMCDSSFLPTVAGAIQPPCGGRALTRLASVAASAEATVAPGARAEVAALLNRSAAHAVPRGMQCVPLAWCELVHPLFTFLRIHLEKHPVASGVGVTAAGGIDWAGSVRFCAIADLWLMILTPWRARPRVKSLLYVPGPAARHFSYADAVCDVVRAAAGDGSAAAAIALHGRVEIMARVRASPQYRACIEAQHDFAAQRIPPTPSEAFRMPDGVSTSSSDSWSSWLGLHYAFYV
jgi:hypothetical protein